MRFKQIKLGQTLADTREKSSEERSYVLVLFVRKLTEDRIWYHEVYFNNRRNSGGGDDTLSAEDWNTGAWRNYEPITKEGRREIISTVLEF